MRITFLSDNFPPEVNAPATRTYEHCKEWVEKGAEVTVITCFPNFPQGKVYDGHKNKFRQTEVIDGIKVIRVWSYMSENDGFIRRLIDFISYAVMSVIVGSFVKTDVIIATSPQFFTTWSGWFLSKIKRKPWIFELRDLWPESIASVGALEKKSFVYKFLEKIEIGLYRSANLIIPNTPAFKKNLVSRGIDPEKIHVIPNGANLELFTKNGYASDLKKQLGIEEDFVYGYIGTHGLAHSLDFIIDTIATSGLDNCHFLFIGDGAEKKRVVQLAVDLNIKNITFLDPVPKDEIPRYLSITDAVLVPLKKSDTFKTVIPSKIFEACAMSTPILLGVEGQAMELIEEYNAGVCFEPENRDHFVKSARLLSEDKELRENLSDNSFELAKSYDRKKLAGEMLQVIEERFMHSVSERALKMQVVTDSIRD